MAQSHTTTPALNTPVESGKFDEKHHTSDPEKVKHESEDGEDEDIDALIEDLESQDGHGEEEDEEEGAAPGGARVIPEDMLQTDTRIGSCSRV
jgi:H+-transporting ATPase